MFEDAEVISGSYSLLKHNFKTVDWEFSDDDINRAREILTKENPTDEDKEELRVLQSQDKATRTFVKNNQEIILRQDLVIVLIMTIEIKDFKQLRDTEVDLISLFH